jgi:hypothetical protein
VNRYCECFSNGEYCHGCECNSCHNTEKEDDSRLKTIKTIISKNPDAFRPKLAVTPIIGTPNNNAFYVSQIIGLNKGRFSGEFQEEHENIPEDMAAESTSITKHIKGCNCRRSYCLKRYCECFHAGIPCAKDCHCIDCKNIEGRRERQNILQLADSLETFSPLRASVKRSRTSEFSLRTLDKVISNDLLPQELFSKSLSFFFLSNRF